MEEVKYSEDGTFNVLRRQDFVVIYKLLGPLPCYVADVNQHLESAGWTLGEYEHELVKREIINRK